MIGLDSALKRFPEIELSYDKTLVKKVHADAFSVLPQGEAALLWITYVGEKRVALLMQLGKDCAITNASPMLLSFHDDLSLGKGTILQGIIFKSSNMTNFACTNIFFHCGNYVHRLKMIDKIELICNILKTQINSRVYMRNGLSIGIPPTTTSFIEALDIAKTLPYSVSHIRSLLMNHYYALGISPYIGSNKVTAVLIVKPALQQDIYHLYTSDNRKHQFPAAIQDYETSVLLNKSFRTIKENANLDTLEESDDEADFEDMRPNKYVDLDKSIAFVCEYIPKFKKWQPIQRSDKLIKITSYKELFILERNNTR